MFTHNQHDDTTTPGGIRIGRVFAASTSALREVRGVIRDLTSLVRAVTENDAAMAQHAMTYDAIEAQAHQRHMEHAHSIRDVMGRMGFDDMHNQRTRSGYGSRGFQG